MAKPQNKPGSRQTCLLFQQADLPCLWPRPVPRRSRHLSLCELQQQISAFPLASIVGTAFSN